MNFNSFEYIFFLLFVVVIYWSQREVSKQNVLLLVASYFFYAFWDWRALGLVIVSTGVNCFVGNWLGSVSQRHRQRLLICGIIFNLGILFFFKYFNFFVDSAADFLNLIGLHAEHSSLQIIVPIGISFYSLQRITYLVSIYRQEIKPSHNFLNFAVFAAFFPQIIAGPIERAVTLLPQVEKARQLDFEQLESGLILIVLGIFKKIVIADVAASLIKPEIFIQPTNYPGGQVVAAIYLFALQIYGDFSGYSDIARGSAKLLGIELMENFRQPYLSQTISEFWQRWHISLSSWLRDYVYMPITRSLLRRWGNRFSLLILIISNIVTMVASGLWHGANWTFIVWGLLFAVYLIISRQLFGKARRFLKHPSSLVRSITITLRIILTFHLVLITWVLFRTPTIEQVPAVYNQILLFFTQGDAGEEGLRIFIPVILLYFLTLAIDLSQIVLKEETFTRKLPVFARTSLYVGAILTIVVFSIRPYVPFIYFKF